MSSTDRNLKRMARTWDYLMSLLPESVMRKVMSVPRATCPVCGMQGIQTGWAEVDDKNTGGTVRVEAINCVACGTRSFTGKRDE